MRCARRRSTRFAGPPSSSLPRNAFSITSRQSMRRIEALALTCMARPDGLAMRTGPVGVIGAPCAEPPARIARRPRPRAQSGTARPRTRCCRREGARMATARKPTLRGRRLVRALWRIVRIYWTSPDAKWGALLLGGAVALEFGAVQTTSVRFRRAAPDRRGARGPRRERLPVHGRAIRRALAVVRPRLRAADLSAPAARDPLAPRPHRRLRGTLDRRARLRPDPAARRRDRQPRPAHRRRHPRLRRERARPLPLAARIRRDAGLVRGSACGASRADG